MQATRQNMFMRDDTFFGVCQALGEDFRFPPNLLRVALALAFFWNPVVILAGYFAAGILVAIVRFIVPDPRPVKSVGAATAAGASGDPAAAPDEAEREVEQLAAAA